MNRLFFITIAFIWLLVFTACRSTKNIQKAIIIKDSVAVVKDIQPTHQDTMKMVDAVLTAVAQKRIEFNTFSAKIRVDYENEKGRQPDFIANIRLLKDSLIWVSLSNDIGIEGIRVLITNDSIKILDKLANTYQVRPLSTIQELSQIPFEFADLQNLLVGNPIFLNKDSITSYVQTANGYNLLSIDVLFKNLITISNEYVIEKSKLDDNDPALNRTCNLVYTEYENKTGKLFSTMREIVIIQQNKLDVKLKFKDYKFNEELSFPFTVPKKFKRIK